MSDRIPSWDLFEVGGGAVLLRQDTDVPPGAVGTVIQTRPYLVIRWQRTGKGSRELGYGGGEFGYIAYVAPVKPKPNDWDDCLELV